MDDLTLIAGNERHISGWTRISLSRGIERFPNGFNISMTDRSPADGGSLLIQPGDPVRVLLGNEVVITGYVDTFEPSLSGWSHTVTVQGRGKCQDLVDCSHDFTGCQMSNATVKVIAQNLCDEYGINVVAMVDTGEPIPQINMAWGDTPYNVIEQCARYRQLLVYENSNGDLVLNHAAQEVKPAAGALIREGWNLESGQMLFSVANRYSKYIVRSLSTAIFSDIGNGADELAVYEDPAISRNRVKSIIAESGDGWGYSITKARAQWEALRRAGRGTQLNVTVDSWRDGEGNLWKPNTLATIIIPSLRIPQATWLISDVTYRRDQSGTHADLVLMPASAFAPEPINLFPTMADVVGAKR